MREKKKEVKPIGGGGGSIFDNVPDPTVSQNVNVASGPYAEDLPVAGKTVGEVRRNFSDRFDIDDQAVAIVNGNPVDENYTLLGSEHLMFVKHAGEKGVVIIEGDKAKAGGFSMKLPELLERCGPGYSTGPVILPAGVKAVLSSGPFTVWFWEQPPRIHQLSWIRKDSPKDFGPGTTYRNVRIALPYMIIAAVFYRNGGDLPQLLLKDECFFRNEPLKSLDDELCYPALLNCSKFNGDPKDNRNPLSWICTQHLKSTKLMKSPEPGDRYQACFEAVRYCLLETSFNLSSEHHEANSWYSESKKIDPRIATIEDWEENTKKDPLFVLDVPWIKTGYSVQGVAERIFQNNGGEATGLPQTEYDLASIIINQ